MGALENHVQETNEIIVANKKEIKEIRNIKAGIAGSSEEFEEQIEDYEADIAELEAKNLKLHTNNLYYKEKLVKSSKEHDGRLASLQKVRYELDNVVIEEEQSVITKTEEESGSERSLCRQLSPGSS